MYEQKSDTLLDPLLEKVQKYNSTYRDQLKEIINDKLSEAEIKALIFGQRTEDEDLIKYPFSKFKRDILEELGIW